MQNELKKLIIIGGGTGGIMLAARLKKIKAPLAITIVEPSDTHWYQPAWTLVGVGTFNFDKTKKPMADFIPDGVTWVKDYATGFKPEENKITTEKSGDLSYDFLVVSPCLVCDSTLIPGLTEALDKGRVCSIYTNPVNAWNVIKNFKGGRAIFTQPNTPIKCGGAPQKIAYLASDYFRKQGISNQVNVSFITPGSVIFGVKIVAETLMNVIKRYNIDFKPLHTLVHINGEKQEATFKYLGKDEPSPFENDKDAVKKPGTDDEYIVKFDMLHLAPPQTAPKFVKESTLVNAAGWLDVDINTLQHKKYSNIFGMGDVAALPTAKNRSSHTQANSGSN